MTAGVQHADARQPGAELYVTCVSAQVAFKGYEEARVALTCLLFTVPCCIIIGVEYGIFMNGELKKVSTYYV
jgi:hypothetical protein